MRGLMRSNNQPTTTMSTTTTTLRDIYTERLTAVTEALALMWSTVREDVEAIDTEDAYSEWLDDNYSLNSVGGPFEWLRPSEVLRKCDMFAYRCGMNQWVDGKCRDDEWVEINDEIYVRRDMERALESYIEDLPEDTTEEVNAALSHAADCI